MPIPILYLERCAAVGRDATRDDFTYIERAELVSHLPACIQQTRKTMESLMQVGFREGAEESANVLEHLEDTYVDLVGID